MYFVVVYAHSGLSPVRERPCRANKTAGLLLIEKQHSPAVYFELFLHVQQLGALRRITVYRAYDPVGHIGFFQVCNVFLS